MALVSDDPEDPCEEWVQWRFVRGATTQSQALVFLTPARALHNGSSVCVIPLRGKASADGEPASVTDEEPAHDSTGRCGQVDLGLALPTSSLVRSDLKDYVDRRTRCHPTFT